MYTVFGIIICDHCQAVVNEQDYLIVKNKKEILHYCNEECKKQKNARTDIKI